MRNKVIILILGVLLCCGGLAQATDFYSDFTIQNGDVYTSSTINLHNTATINMKGGQVADILALDASVLNVSGGSLGGLSLVNASTANLTGGVISLVEALDQSTVNIYGYGFTSTQYGTSVLLSGFWADDSLFTIQLRRIEFPDSHYLLHEVPEPVSLVFLGVGVIFLRAKNK